MQKPIKNNETAFINAISMAIEHSDFTPESLFRSIAHLEFLENSRQMDIHEFLAFVEEYLCCLSPASFADVSASVVAFWFYVMSAKDGADGRCECFEEGASA